MIKAPKESTIYDDDRLYVCLAEFPITKGHTIVIWKQNVHDLHLLSRGDFEHLMNIVDRARNAMLKALHVKKVYLLYMDELQHVHWHLVPRYDEKGFNVFKHQPEKISDFSLAKEIKDFF